MVKVIGAGEAPKHQMGGKVDLTYSGAVWSGPAAFAEAGVKPSDMKYASIYDSFTITVIMQLEDLGFCEKGQGGRFVSDGNLIAGSRQTAVQHRRRRPVQQPPVEPRRADQGIGGGAAIARRGAPGGAGQELRSGAGARHRRLARHQARRRDRHHGKGVTAMAQGQQAAGERKITPPPVNVGDAGFLGRGGAGQAADQEMHRLRRGAFLPAHTSARSAFRDKTEWQEASGRGTIYTYSVMRRAPVPYAIAYVELAEGPRIMTNIVDCDLNAIKIGQAVRLVFKPSEGGPPVPMFAPV